MNKTINRSWINRDIRWHQVDNNYNVDHVSDYDEIVASIDHWKNILTEQANFGVGSTATVDLIHRDMRWLSLLFAIWELGGSLVLRNPNPDHKNIHAPFTVAVVDNKESIAAETEFANCVLMLDIWHDYVSNGLQKSEPIVPDNLPLINAITISADLSVTLLEYSYAFSSELGQRCVDILDLKSDDCIMHMHGSHHGGGINNMLLPSLLVCKNHYGAILNYELMPQIGNLVEQQGITKVAMPNNLATERFIQHAPVFTKPVHILSFQGNQPNWLEHMKEKNIGSVLSLFGSMATCGPVLINRINKDDGPLHDCMNFGFPLDDFYKVELIDDKKLQITNKYQGTVIFPDEFELTDTGYVFKHRASHTRINFVVFSTVDLDNIVKQITNPSLVYLLADTTMDRVYLLVDHSIESLKDVVDAINTEIVNNVSPLVQINYVDQVDASFYKQNNQFNEFQVRNHFRTKFKLR
jgi:hypothetical protein